MISSAVRFVDPVALLTTLSKLSVENGIVRISAGMVEILLNSYPHRQNAKNQY
jgi:hypothetical protein